MIVSSKAVTCKIASALIDNGFRCVSWVLFSCQFRWWNARTEQALATVSYAGPCDRHRMRRGRHSSSIPLAPPCVLCFLGQWLMSYDLKRNSAFGQLIEDQYRRGDYRGPEAAFVADGGLGHVGGADDFVGEAVDLLLLVPGAVGIELDVQRSSEHFGG